MHGPPPASPTSVRSASESESECSEESREIDLSPKEMEVSVGSGCPEYPKTEGAAKGEVEGIAASMASMIVSEAIAAATGAAPGDSDGVGGGDSTDSEISPAEGAWGGPSPGGSEERVEGTDVSPEVSKAHVVAPGVRFGGQGAVLGAAPHGGTWGSALGCSDTP